MAENNTHIDDTFLAQWMADELSDLELKKLVSDDDYLAYKKIKEGITVYQHIEAPTDKTYTAIKHKIALLKAKKQPKTISIYYKVALAVAASLVLFFSLNKFFFSEVTNQTGFGELKTITLLDGSEVILNAKSTLSYNKNSWKNNREVALNGEGFFKVKKGSSFTVTTTNGTVTVLGTQFNVNTNPTFFEVTCFTGKVKVINKDKTYILTPNKSFRNDNGKVLEEQLTLNKQPSWVNGESSFRAVPLRQVILALEKQYNITFKPYNIDDSVIFTGSFDNNNLEVALASVFETVQINYSVKNNIVTLERQ